MGVTSLAARAWRHFFSIGVPNFGLAAATPTGPAPTALNCVHVDSYPGLPELQVCCISHCSSMSHFHVILSLFFIVILFVDRAGCVVEMAL